MMKAYDFKTIVRKYGVLFALVIVFLIFSVMEPSFYSIKNLLAIIRQSSITGILAIGLTAVVVAGEFDMSFAASAGFSGVVSIILMGQYSFGAIPAWIVGIGVALVVGLINGLIIIKLGVPSMIETIGMMTLLSGLSKWMTGGSTYYSVNFPDLLPVIGRGSVFGVIPTPVIIFIIIIFIFFILFEHTKLGRYIHAVGGNKNAAEHVGIKVDNIKFKAFFICALLAGLGGIMIGSLLSSGTPSMGEAYLIPSISSMFIGAVFLKDGIPNIWGSVIGAILLSILSNGFVMINMPFYLKDIIMGLVLIGSVSLVAISKKGEIPGIKLM